MDLQSIPEAFQTKLRLAIVSALYTGEKDFNALKALTGATDGNLSVQLTKLQEMGLVQVERGFSGRRTRTLCRLTPPGRRQFADYVQMLAGILAQGQDPKDAQGREG